MTLKAEDSHCRSVSLFAKQSKHALGTQTSSSMPLIPEFSHFVFTEDPCTQEGLRLLASPFPGDTSSEMQGEVDDGMPADTNKRKRTTYKYGQQWTAVDFFRKAKVLEHPRNPQAVLPDVIKEALVHLLSSDAIAVAKHRLQVVLAVKRRLEELKPDEEELRASMPSDVRSVLASKRMRLWMDLAEKSGFTDKPIFELIAKGIPLYGEHPPCGLFMGDWKPALMHEDELLQTAAWRRKALQGSSPSLDAKEEDLLHEATLEEVSKGYLFGPYTEREVTELFGTDEWIFSPRFAVVQGQGNDKKVRPIDDCKRSGLNHTFTTNFKLELYDMDTLACLISLIADSLKAGVVEVVLSNGDVVRHEVHASVLDDSWVGRTLDLSKAYKQLPTINSSQLTASHNV